MVLKGVSVISLLNPAAILIIIVGTAASVIVAFPASEIKKCQSCLELFLKKINDKAQKYYFGFF